MSSMSGRSNASREGRVIHKGLLRQYKAWLQGQEDRRNGKGCLSANGKYLDGWYNPGQSVPDFFTINELVAYRQVLSNSQQ